MGGDNSKRELNHNSKTLNYTSQFSWFWKMKAFIFSFICLFTYIYVVSVICLPSSPSLTPSISQCPHLNQPERPKRWTWTDSGNWRCPTETWSFRCPPLGIHQPWTSWTLAPPLSHSMKISQRCRRRSCLVTPFWTASALPMEGKQRDIIISY